VQRSVKPDDGKSESGRVTDEKSKVTRENDRHEVRSRYAMTDAKSDVMEGGEGNPKEYETVLTIYHRPSR
jgi:hypothetical protein